MLAIFGRSKVQWPPSVLALYRYLSALNFNLEITAPECSIPSLKYDVKWMAIELMPVLGGVALVVVFVLVFLYRRCVGWCFGSAGRNVVAWGGGFVCVRCASRRTFLQRYPFVARCTELCLS